MTASTSPSSHPATASTPAGKSRRQPVMQNLPGLPTRALTPQQQLEALQRIDQQAQQRVKLGLQLFKAAEAHTNSHRQLLEEIKAQRETFRDEIAQDVSKTLHTYDQWIGQMDDSYTQALLTLEARINELDAKVDASAARLENMLRQSQKLLTQAQAMLDEKAAIAPTVNTPPPAKTVSTTHAPTKDATEDAADDTTINAAATETTFIDAAVAPSPVYGPHPADEAPISSIAPITPSSNHQTVTQPAGESDDHSVHTDTPVADDAPAAQPLGRKVSYAELLTRIHQGREHLKKDV